MFSSLRVFGGQLWSAKAPLDIYFMAVETLTRGAGLTGAGGAMTCLTSDKTWWLLRR